MLQTVFARSGSPKNQYILDKIKELAFASDRKIMVLVPEQSSFETEKELYLALGDRLYSRIEVVSFTRLCRLISDIYGSKKGKRLSNAGKMILSSLAAEKAAPELKIYGKQISSPAFVEKISSIIDELKSAGISAEGFENLVTDLDTETVLNDKLSDLKSIYQWYDNFIKDNYIDPSEQLIDCVEKLGAGEFFKDYDVIIDEFVSFNTAQYSIIEKMLVNSANVVFILCCVEKNNINPEFKTPYETFNKIKNLAKKNFTEISTPISLDSGAEYNNEDIKRLENFMVDEISPEEFLSDGVRLFSAENIKSECRFIASEIRRLVREENLRYRDIAVIGREMNDYLFYLEDSFNLYGIPCFVDRREPLDTRPVVVVIKKLFETIISDFDPQSLLIYLKCPASPIDNDDAVLLENYIDLWKLNKRELLKKFEKNPNGFDGEFNDEALEKLCKLNQIRDKAIEPLVKFKKEILSKTNGAEITKCLYSFLKDNGILDNLSKYTESIAKIDTSLAAEQYRAYEICMGVLSQLASILEKTSVTIKRYLELFLLALSSEDVGSIPHHLDEVTVGDAGRMRSGNVKVAFVIGLNEGLFPKHHVEDGFFTDDDRETVRKSGADILTPSKMMNQNEKFYLYLALTSATDRLYLSYSKLALDSSGLIASRIIDKLKSKMKLQETEIRLIGKEAYLETDESAFEQLCLNYNKNDEFSNSLREYFMTSANDVYRQRLLSIDKGLRIRTSSIDENVANELYGKTMLISPSQIENYYRCKFMHFCKHGLSLKTEKQTEITVLDVGNAIHRVMERLIKEHTKDEILALSDDNINELVEKYLNDFLIESIGVDGMNNSRVKYSVMRLKVSILKPIKFVIEELRVSGFVPHDFELPIEKGEEIEPYIIRSEGGTDIGIHGRIDRVDTKEKDGNTYVRVVDYKSGKKKFSPEEIEYGINLQMLLYLFSIWENGGQKYGNNITPSGVLYMNTVRPEVDADGLNRDKIIGKQNDELKMSGYLIDDPNVNSEGEKLYTKATEGNISELEAIKNQTEKLLCSMADDLKLGKLEIVPTKNGNETPCKYCDFKGICGFEDGDEVREIVSKKGADKNA